MHRVVRGNRLTRIAPEAIEHVVLHQSVLEEPVVHVSDLELSAPGRLELGQHLPYRRVIKVNARDGEVAGRLLGFLDNPFDPALAVELGDAQVAKVLVGDAGQGVQAASGASGQDDALHRHRILGAKPGWPTSCCGRLAAAIRCRDRTTGREPSSTSTLTPSIPPSTSATIRSFAAFRSPSQDVRGAR